MTIIDLERGPAVDDQGDWSTDTDTAEFLREIVEFSTVPPVLPSDITVTRFAEAADNISKKTARDRLDALVRCGKLTTPEGKRSEPGTNRRVRVWRRVVQE